MVLGVGVSGTDLAAQFNVGNRFNRLAEVSLRLGTLQRINSAKDDPAGLIAAEQLNRELAARQRASATLDRSRALVNVADTALAHTSSMLTDIQANVVAAANDTFTPEQRDALQQEVDAALDSIHRLGQTTFAGKPIFGEPLQILVGPEPFQVETLDLPAVDDSLGGTSGVLADLRSGGSANLTTGDLESAAAILDEAQAQILAARADAGAFERTVIDSTQRVMEDTEVNLASALSAIRDTDMAAETSNLVRERILAQTALQTAKLTSHAKRLIAGTLIGGFNERA